MLVTTDGIVLKQRKIAGNRRMIVLFTRKYGKISSGTGINERSRSKSALLLRPFTYAEYELYKGRGTYNIDGGSVKESFFSLGEDIDRFLTASQLIDYLDKILEEGQQRQGLFDLTLELLRSLTAARSNYSTLLYAFIVKSLRMQGIMPELARCANCGKPLDEIRAAEGAARNFSVTAGGILCEACCEKEKSLPDTLIFRPDFDIVDILIYFTSKPMGVFEKVVLKEAAESELKRIISGYIEYYLDVDVLKNDFTI